MAGSSDPGAELVAELHRVGRKKMKRKKEKKGLFGLGGGKQTKVQRWKIEIKQRVCPPPPPTRAIFH